MIATYKTNANVLDQNLMNSIKSAFSGKDIRIIGSEIPKTSAISSDEINNRIYELTNDINTVSFTAEEFEKFVEDISANK